MVNQSSYGKGIWRRPGNKSAMLPLNTMLDFLVQVALVQEGTHTGGQSPKRIV